MTAPALCECGDEAEPGRDTCDSCRPCVICSVAAADEGRAQFQILIGRIDSLKGEVAASEVERDRLAEALSDWKECAALLLDDWQSEVAATGGDGAVGRGVEKWRTLTYRETEPTCSTCGDFGEITRDVIAWHGDSPDHDTEARPCPDCCTATGPIKAEP